MATETSTTTSPDKDAAADFLRALLNKTLRVTTTDARMFWGQFKCTDPDRNVILAHTYEYRQPSPQKRSEVVAAAEEQEGPASVTMEMASRYLGLVVVPGQHIAKLEVEEFASQIREGDMPW